MSSLSTDKPDARENGDNKTAEAVARFIRITALAVLLRECLLCFPNGAWRHPPPFYLTGLAFRHRRDAYDTLAPVFRRNRGAKARPVPHRLEVYAPLRSARTPLQTSTFLPNRCKSRTSNIDLGTSSLRPPGFLKPEIEFFKLPSVRRRGLRLTDIAHLTLYGVTACAEPDVPVETLGTWTGLFCAA